jgi:hypothetical protein
VTREQRDGARAHLRIALDSLASLLAVIDEVGPDVSAASPAIRRQVRYLWIVIGSRLKEHARALERTRSKSGFADAIRFRDKLAYSSPGAIVDSVVWETSTSDGPRLADDMRDALDAWA